MCIYKKMIFAMQICRHLREIESGAVRSCVHRLCKPDLHYLISGMNRNDSQDYELVLEQEIKDMTETHTSSIEYGLALVEVTGIPFSEA